MNKYVAEFIGTMILVFFGTGTAVVTSGLTAGIAGSFVGVMAIALAFGLTIVAGAYAIGHISGCHVNPAVSLGVFMAGRMDAKDFGGYVIAQIIGATLTMVHLIGIPLTGTSVNPARSLSPAVFLGGEALSQVWLFIAAPLVGAAIAAIVHRGWFSNDED